MYCLWCHSPLNTTINWKFTFGLSTHQPVCNQCTEKLEKIQGDICAKCGRPFSHLEAEYRHGQLCHDCIRWGDTSLLKNRSLYVYNDFLQEIIAKWKYRGDAELTKLFHNDLKNLAKQIGKIDAVVPIPLSQQRQYERSFNQAKLLAEALPYPLIEALIKRDDAQKQSKKTRQQRMQQQSKFNLHPHANIKEMSILLIDDIYTTGATLHSAAHLLKDGGAASIVSLTIARG